MDIHVITNALLAGAWLYFYITSFVVGCIYCMFYLPSTGRNIYWYLYMKRKNRADPPMYSCTKDKFPVGFEDYTGIFAVSVSLYAVASI